MTRILKHSLTYTLKLGRKKLGNNSLENHLISIIEVSWWPTKYLQTFSWFFAFWKNLEYFDIWAEIKLGVVR